MMVLGEAISSKRYIFEQKWIEINDFPVIFILIRNENFIFSKLAIQMIVWQ